MSAQSNKSVQTTFWDTPSTTSSPASADGRLLCGGPAGPTSAQCGRGAAPASPSVRPAEERDSTTTDTCGPCFATSFDSAVLSSSLANRLAADSGGIGSCEYNRTLKIWDSPSGRSIPALRASAPRTSGRASTGWPTPVRKDGNSAARATRLDPDPSGSMKPGTTLTDAARFASGWPTPVAGDQKWRHSNPESVLRRMEKGNKQLLLEGAAQLAGWPTPASTDHKGGYQGGRIRGGKLSTDRLDTAAQLAGQPQASPETLGGRQSGSVAATANRGALNPELSRWLMGYPDAWGYCGATVTRSASLRPKRS